MERLGKVIIIANNKGGAMKSTLTSFFMNFLHLVTQYKVLGIDADSAQETLTVWRESDLKNQDVDPEKLYHLETIFPSDVPAILESRRLEYDFIFIDLPGSVLPEGVRECYAIADYVIVPHALSNADIDSTARFIKDYNEIIAPIRRKMGLEVNIKAILARIDNKMKEFSEFRFLVDKLKEILVNEEMEIDSEKLVDVLEYKYFGKLLNGKGFIVDYFDSFIPENKTTFQRDASTYRLYAGRKNGVDEYAELYKEFYNFVL